MQRYDEIQKGLFFYETPCRFAVNRLLKMQEKFSAKGKKLYFGFVHFEKAFDIVPREVIRWAMRKLGVEECLVSAVMSMYTGAKSVVTVTVLR